MPFQPPERLEPDFAFMATELANEIDRPVQFRTASTNERFFERLEAEAYDWAIVDFYDFLRLDSEVYAPLVQASTDDVVQVIVRNDSTIQVASDLQGQVISLGGPEVIRRMGLTVLRDNNLEPKVEVTIQVPRASAPVCSRPSRESWPDAWRRRSR